MGVAAGAGGSSLGLEEEAMAVVVERNGQVVALVVVSSRLRSLFRNPRRTSGQSSTWI